MTTKPTPEQARAYAEAFIAWSEGKKVEQKHNEAFVVPYRRDWHSFQGEAYTDGAQYRIVPDPPKAREWWINIYPVGFAAAHLSKDGAKNQASPGCLECVQVREILDTEIVVDKAEYEELRRNEAALKATVYDNNQRFPKGDIFARARLFGAKL